ncbi:MAG: type I glutamate--ammonia ligase [Chloroflexota bacterium]
MTGTPDILATIEEKRIRFVDLWFTDITGGVKSVTIPANQLENAIENGQSFDGSSLESFTRVAESDMLLMPDVDTFTIMPWEADHERTARLICNVHTIHGDPFIGDPRVALIRVLEQAKEMGYAYKTGMELEFFLFHENDIAGQPLRPIDGSSYFDLANDEVQLIRRRMLTTLKDMSIEVVSSHHENGSGQHEIDLMFDHALDSADRIMTARVALKAVARQHNLCCTFMPRPSMDLPGSGMHTHQSLHDSDSGANVFGSSDDNDDIGLSDVAQQFLAGQLAHARAMAAILAPLVNSYKRLGTSFEAPVYVTWAHINRAALIRVPAVESRGADHARVEMRLPDPSSNPYLASAVMLAAGLDGIQQKMQLTNPLEETILQQNRARLRQVEVLPNSLRQALEALAEDNVVLGALGPYISDRYLDAKRQEYDEYSRQVTAWELQRYLGRY